jgi:hypothetical protein
LLGDINAKVRREDILKPTIGNEGHEVSNDNAIGEIKILPHQKI